MGIRDRMGEGAAVQLLRAAVVGREAVAVERSGACRGAEEGQGSKGKLILDPAIQRLNWDNTRVRLEQLNSQIKCPLK
jgi:hypothetical protein